MSIQRPESNSDSFSRPDGAAGAIPLLWSFSSPMTEVTGVPPQTPMKKQMMTVAALVAVGLAGAQSWQGGYGQYQLGSCYSVSTGVRCDLTYTQELHLNR